MQLLISSHGKDVVMVPVVTILSEYYYPHLDAEVNLGVIRLLARACDSRKIGVVDLNLTPAGRPYAPPYWGEG